MGADEKIAIENADLEQRLGFTVHSPWKKPRSKLWIGYSRQGNEWSCQLLIESHGRVPNWWWRLWYWVLLGWKWERIEDDNDTT